MINRLTDLKHYSVLNGNIKLDIDNCILDAFTRRDGFWLHLHTVVIFETEEDNIAFILKYNDIIYKGPLVEWHNI